MKNSHHHTFLSWVLDEAFRALIPFYKPQSMNEINISWCYYAKFILGLVNWTDSWKNCPYFFPLEINIYFKLIEVLSIFLDYFNHFLTSSRASAFDSHSLFLKRTGMILSTREFIYFFKFMPVFNLCTIYYLCLKWFCLIWPQA